MNLKILLIWKKYLAIRIDLSLLSIFQAFSSKLTVLGKKSKLQSKLLGMFERY